MTNARSFRALVAFLAMLSAVLLIAAAASAVEEKDKRHHRIVASWHVTVSFDDLRPDVLALYTFNHDRTFTMGGSWPAIFGPGHGAWSRNRDNDQGNDPDDDSAINLTFFRLLYSPTTGAFNGILKVQAKLTVSEDGQSFIGRYSLTNFDPLGNVRSTATGGLNATRIVVEPLP